jgi:hypothetical protein
MGLFDPGMGILSGILRGKPNLPGFNPINVQEEQQKAIAGNQAALPGIENLVGGINKFNMDQITQMLNQTLPGFQGMQAQAGSTISQEMAGQIPQADQNVVQDSAAAKALGGGYGGSGAHGALVARDLGLTSLAITQQGLSSFEDWTQKTDALYAPALGAGQALFSSMFVTPGQQIASDTSERNAQFQHDWTQNQIDWQSSLGYLAGNELQTDSSQLNSMIGSIAGSAAGGGGGGGGGL